mmetsp:Transcript_6033/g.13306  ORF Transcript_6033/g.13306 Transcript_6033/m.13306 type:complete len:250 (+) Transcript_6033:302-1051(+)
MPSGTLLQEVQSSSSSRWSLIQGTSPTPVRPLEPASFTRCRLGDANSIDDKPLSVRCQHHDKSISSNAGCCTTARVHIALSAKNSHSAKESSVQLPGISCAICGGPPSCAALLSAALQLLLTALWLVKKPAHSTSFGCEAFFSVKLSSLARPAISHSAAGSKSRAKEIAKLRSSGQVFAKQLKYCPSKSSPSRLRCINFDNMKAPSVRSWPMLNRKHPSRCNAVQASCSGRSKRDEASVSFSQCRTSSE